MPNYISNNFISHKRGSIQGGESFLQATDSQIPSHPWPASRTCDRPLIEPVLLALSPVLIKAVKYYHQTDLQIQQCILNTQRF